MTELATEAEATTTEAVVEATTTEVSAATETQTTETPSQVEYASTDFVLPENSTIAPVLLEEYVANAKEAGLSKETAQKFLDMGQKVSERIHAEHQAAWDARRTEWEEAAKSDKEYGGEKFNENLAVAAKAYHEFATPELKALLDSTGLGNHPDMIRAFYKAGLLLSEDKVVAADRATAQSGNDPRSLYPNSNLK